MNAGFNTNFAWADILDCSNERIKVLYKQRDKLMDEKAIVMREFYSLGETIKQEYLEFKSKEIDTNALIKLEEKSEKIQILIIKYQSLTEACDCVLSELDTVIKRRCFSLKSINKQK